MFFVDHEAHACFFEGLEVVVQVVLLNSPTVAFIRNARVFHRGFVRILWNMSLGLARIRGMVKRIRVT